MPLKPQAQNGFLRLGHALDAWIALDVFAVVVAICSLDFGRITWYAAHEGDMKEACHWMKRPRACYGCYTVVILFGGLLRPQVCRELSTAACVRADVKLEKGFIMLAAAAVALLLVPKALGVFFFLFAKLKLRAPGRSSSLPEGDYQKRPGNFDVCFPDIPSLEDFKMSTD